MAENQRGDVIRPSVGSSVIGTKFMSTLRKHGTGFTQVSNELLNDEKLSFKAKGLYAYLFSKPDGWDFEAGRIARQSSDGRRAVLSGLSELENVGYIKRNKLNNGRLEYELLANISQSAETAPCDLGTVQKPHGAKTDTISNKDNNSNTDYNSNKELEDTPKQKAIKFFNNEDDLQTKAVNYLESKGMPRPRAISEMVKFKNYWTELTPSGKKQRWETEKTFEVGRRLATWVMKSVEYRQVFAKTKGKEIIGL